MGLRRKHTYNVGADFAAGDCIVDNHCVAETGWTSVEPTWEARGFRIDAESGARGGCRPSLQLLIIFLLSLVRAYRPQVSSRSPARSSPSPESASP